MAVPAKVGPDPRVREFDNLWIPLADGARLSAHLWLPPEAEAQPVPAVVEVSPYRHGDHTRRRDSVRHPYFAERGYASLRIDVRGSGASDGVLEDEYSQREQDDVCEALAWVAAQPWSNGSVGMIGLSWGGFAALQAASRRPPELNAIVVVCASADRYGADVKYRGGAVLGCELLPWSSTMLAMSVRPPDPAVAMREEVLDIGPSGWRPRLHSRRRGSRTNGETTIGEPGRRARTTPPSNVPSTPWAAGPTLTGRPSSTSWSSWTAHARGSSARGHTSIPRKARRVPQSTSAVNACAGGTSG